MIRRMREYAEELERAGNPPPFVLGVTEADYAALLDELTLGRTYGAVIFRDEEGNLTFEDIVVAVLSPAQIAEAAEEGSCSFTEDEDPNGH